MFSLLEFFIITSWVCSLCFSSRCFSKANFSCCFCSCRTYKPVRKLSNFSCSNTGFTLFSSCKNNATPLNRKPYLQILSPLNNNYCYSLQPVSTIISLKKKKNSVGTEQEIVIRTNKIRIFNFTETIKTQKSSKGTTKLIRV